MAQKQWGLLVAFAFGMAVMAAVFKLDSRVSSLENGNLAAENEMAAALDYRDSWTIRVNRFASANVMVQVPGEGFRNGCFVTRDGQVLTSAYRLGENGQTTGSVCGADLHGVPIQSTYRLLSVDRERDLALLEPESPLNGQIQFLTASRNAPNEGEELVVFSLAWQRDSFLPAPATVVDEHKMFRLSRRATVAGRLWEKELILECPSQTALAGSPVVDRDGRLMGLLSSVDRRPGDLDFFSDGSLSTMYTLDDGPLERMRKN